MGWDYVQHRIMLTLKQKLGLRKKEYPVNPEPQVFIGLEDWKALPVKFFFDSKNDVSVGKKCPDSLKRDFEAFLNGQMAFFNAEKIHIGRDYDWVSNPSNGFQYDTSKHWTEIEDFSENAGDIKYVWEKSRFSYIYTLIRYDKYFNVDKAELVFSEILSWIDANPINQGPNYKCSQETSLRTLNWIFALYYYKQSSFLSENVFQKIMHVVYWQIKHVRSNINFSRKTVRNNHAITEVMMLYLGGVLFPFLPEAVEWKRVGKKWFEEEIAYQVYEDGTFLQFSHNYHRVLVQLMTWAFYLAELNGDRFSEKTYDRGKKTLNYLYQCIDLNSGELPNYGANDGALFFKLNDLAYRDYRGTLNALYYFFNRNHLFQAQETQEDVAWYAPKLEVVGQGAGLKQEQLNSFVEGGYYTMRDKDSFTFIKCGSYKDRPSHADNLHLDIWYKGMNVLQDSGTFRYNTTQDLMSYFTGTKGHNTVTLGDFDQMEKGSRFIWLKWMNRVSAALEEKSQKYVFDGKVQAFKHVGKNIFHQRKVTKSKNKPEWVVEDFLDHNEELPIKQYWHLTSKFDGEILITATDESGKKINPRYEKGWYSSFYGVKEIQDVIVFISNTKRIKTTIKIK